MLSTLSSQQYQIFPTRTRNVPYTPLTLKKRRGKNLIKVRRETNKSDATTVYHTVYQKANQHFHDEQKDPFSTSLKPGKIDLSKANSSQNVRTLLSTIHLCSVIHRTTKHLVQKGHALHVFNPKR